MQVGCVEGQLGGEERDAYVGLWVPGPAALDRTPALACDLMIKSCRNEALSQRMVPAKPHPSFKNQVHSCHWGHPKPRTAHAHQYGLSLSTCLQGQHPAKPRRMVQSYLTFRVPLQGSPPPPAEDEREEERGALLQGPRPLQTGNGGSSKFRDVEEGGQ